MKKNHLGIFLSLFLIVTITQTLYAQTSATDLMARDETGTLYSYSLVGDVLNIDQFDGNAFSTFMRINTEGAGSLRSVVYADRPVVILQYNDDLVIELIENAKLQRIATLPGAGEARFVETALQGNTLLTAFDTGNELSIARFSLASGAMTSRGTITLHGRLRSLDLLWSGIPHIAWETGADEGVTISTATFDGDSPELFYQFEIAPHGSSAGVQLIAEGEDINVVWRAKYGTKSRLYRRSLTNDSQAELLHLPEPATAQLTARRAFGDNSAFAAASLAEGQWALYKGKLEGGRIAADVSFIENGHALEPVLAVTSHGEQLIIEDPANPRNLTAIPKSRLASEPTARPETPAKDDKQTTSILAFGDSITAGKLYIRDEDRYIEWFNGYNGYLPPLKRLFKKYFGKVNIKQAGLSGEKTDAGLVRLQGLLEKPGARYDIVLLLEGTNDYYLGGWILPVENTIPNQIEMIALIRKHGAIPIVGTMLPRDKSSDGRADERAEDVTDAMIPMARQQGVILAEFHKLFPLDRDYLDDRYNRMLHPTDTGYKFMAEIWIDALLPLYGDVDRNGKIEQADLDLLIFSLKQRIGSSMFNANTDADQNGVVNAGDFLSMMKSLGTLLIPEEDVLRNKELPTSNN